MAHRTSARPGPGPVDAYGTSRRSPLLPGLALVHADLHNHTWLSDGRGDPARAFDSLRRAGLDVAAITDHATMAIDRADLAPWNSIDERAWERLGELAADAHDDGTFVAMRGFEWSHSLLGHMNVWGSPAFVNPFRTDGPSILPFLEWLCRD